MYMQYEYVEMLGGKIVWLNGDGGGEAAVASGGEWKMVDWHHCRATTFARYAHSILF